MKETILNALKAAGVPTEGLDDAQLLAEFSKLSTNSGGGNGHGNAQGADISAAVANALQPLVARLDGIENSINQKTTEEHNALASTVANSGRFPGLDEDSAKLLPLEKLRTMAANVGIAHGVPLTTNMGGKSSGVPVDMPE